jgi:putative ABC transport system permease protein
MGSATLTGATTPRQWAELSDAARRELPGMRLLRLRGVAQSPSGDRFVSLTVSVAGVPASGSYTQPYGSDFLVASRVPRAGLGVPADARANADRTLARGGVVVLTDHATHGRHGRNARIHLEIGDVSGGLERSATVTAVATVARTIRGVPRAQAVMAPSVAHKLGVPVATTALWLPGPVTAAAAENLSEEANAAGGLAYVERGYQPNDETRIVQLVLGVLGAVLMLGGTLTATFLALSDARTDLATLSAVGASPRMRRRVAAAYAAVTGLVGALLGVLVGFVPGIAVSFPLTADVSADPVPGTASHYLDIPWLLIGSLVVALPLLTALVVGATSRARLPLVARVD